MSETTLYSEDDLFARLVEGLHKMLNTTYVGVYSYNQSHQTFIRKEGVLPPPNYLIEMNQFDTLKLTDEEPTCTFELEKEKVFVSKLMLNDKRSNLILIIVHKNVIDHCELLFIKRETECLMNMYYGCHENRNNEKRNEILFSLSTLLHSTTDKTTVLTNLITALDDIFPLFSHVILLSHDFENDESLPIKSIEYGESNGGKGGTQAFITGDIHIENGINPDHNRLYTPLLGRQGVYGVIQMTSKEIIYFSESELDFITNISNTAGKALENAVLYEDSIDQASDLRLINQATHRLNSCLELTELVGVLKKELVDICRPSEIGIVYLDDQTEREYTILSESSSFFDKERGRSYVDSIYKKMNEKSEADFSSDHSQKHPRCEYYSIMSIPMITSGQIYGFVILLHERKMGFSFKQFRLAQSITDHATLALVNAALKERLEKMVITDYLTGLYSRKYLDEMLNKHMQTDKQGIFILFDIDDFKKINDRFGHIVGDEVIIKIADIIKSFLTPQDIASRWGGEEFAIYLPDVGLIKGVQVAESIRRKVAEETSPTVTFSCGLSTWDGIYGDSGEHIFIRADRALYEAKRIGKNRVIIDNQLADYTSQSILQ